MTVEAGSGLSAQVWAARPRAPDHRRLEFEALIDKVARMSRVVSGASQELAAVRRHAGRLQTENQYLRSEIGRLEHRLDRGGPEGCAANQQTHLSASANPATFGRIRTATQRLR
jgi:regulator of replication initiation timing